ncbi:aminotransferase class IV [Fulvivirgaceae bacterium LMO-SS25]
MKVIYNSRTVEESNLGFFWSNRAYMYGDSLFETIFCYQGQAMRLRYHVDRLKKGMEILEMDANESISEKNLQEEITQLILLNRIDGDFRIRLQVVRKAGGYYTPTQNSCDYIMMVTPMKWSSYGIKAKVGIANSVHTVFQSFSFCKTGSALTYVKAGLEMRKRELNEILITDTNGNISEASSSNIFWIKDNQLFTPSLETGCINGVRRRWIIDEMLKIDKHVIEVKAQITELSNADYLFTSNATGIHFIAALDGKEYKTPANSNPPAFLAALLVP